MVNVQKWESTNALGQECATHHSITYDELVSLIRTYGGRLTCARMADHGTGGLANNYHH